jgi:lipopolysaccharide export system permease protein
MFSVKQLDSVSKVEKINYDNYLYERSISLYSATNASKIYKYPDSLINKELKPEILDNFTLNNQLTIVSEVLQTVKRSVDRDKNNKITFKNKRKLLNLYDFEFSYRISFSLACLVLFFIGAPLGSIIRKGGFGLPMIMAITIFVIYFFISQLGKNLSEESAISTLFGSWLSTLILLPFGIILTRRASKGMGIFNIDSIFDNLKKFFNRFTKKSIN